MEASPRIDSPPTTFDSSETPTRQLSPVISREKPVECRDVNEQKKSSLEHSAARVNSKEIPLLDDPSLFPEGGIQAYLVLIGSFCGMVASLSFINSGGAMQNYLQSHILDDVPVGTIGWIFSLISFIEFGALIIIGPYFDRVGARTPLIMGIVLSTIGFLCSSWATETYQFILSYSILGGTGSSLIFCTNIGVLSHWFLKKRGQAIGLAYMGGAIGGAVFPVMYTSLFDKIGFGWTIRCGTLICLVLLLVSLALIKDRREVFSNPETTQQSILTQVLKSIDISVFKDKVYTCLVLSLLGQGFAFLVTMTYITSYSTAHGNPEAKSYYLLLVFNCLSIPGRLLPGILADKYGRFNMLCVICVSSTITIFVCWINPKVAHSMTGLFIFAGIYGFTSGSTLSLAPTCVGQISKTEDFAKRTGTAFFVLSLGDLIGIPVGGAIAGAGDNAQSFENMVIFVVVLSTVGTVGALLLRYLYVGLRKVRV